MRLRLLLIRLKNFWSDFAPCIVDLQSLGYWDSGYTGQDGESKKTKIKTPNNH